MSKPNPNYYAIVPANVRYDRDLVPNAKLLYGEITALANLTGECTASNKYFAELYDVAPTRISAWISLLVEKGYVSVRVEQTAGNKRYISLPIQEIQKTSSEKVEDPSSRKVEDNNTSINNKNINKIYETYLRFHKLAGLSPNDSTYQEKLESAKKRYKLTPARRDAVERRLADAGFNMTLAAVVGYGRSDWHLGNNPSGWTADLMKFICRSYEKIEEGANLYEKQKKGGNTADPWGKL